MGSEIYILFGFLGFFFFGVLGGFIGGVSRNKPKSLWLRIIIYGLVSAVLGYFLFQIPFNFFLFGSIW